MKEDTARVPTTTRAGRDKGDARRSGLVRPRLNDQKLREECSIIIVRDTDTVCYAF